MMGKENSAETHAKISKAMTGKKRKKRKKHSTERCAKISEVMMGKEHSAETLS